MPNVKFRDMPTGDDKGPTERPHLPVVTILIGILVVVNVVSAILTIIE